MTIRTKLTIGGTEYKDYKNLRVSRSIGDYNSSSEFTAILDSPYGRHKNDFTVGDEVVIKADKDSDPTTIIFTGILEKINFDGEGVSQVVRLKGRDYAARLQDLTVQPIVYTNAEISTIVAGILADNQVTDITTNNVNVTSTTLERIAFNHKTVFEALSQLAELAGFIFWVDENKDLHFEEKASTSSGYTLDNTNILGMRFDTTREGMANKIWIYGDRYLAGFREEISTNGGSVYTLLHRPHNAFIEVLGNPQKGGVYQLTNLPVSGVDYLVNFFDREIIFVSGTELGYSSIPPNGGSFIVTYDRDIPIAKYGQDDVSINLYGPKEMVINDKSIKDPTTAKEILLKKLEESSPLNQFEVDLDGWFTFNVGETVAMVLNDFNINESELTILNITYTFDKNTIHSEHVIKVRLSKKIFDITDKIKDLDRRLKGIEAQDLQDTDVLTRLFFNIGSLMVIGSRWNVYTTSIGTSFILGHPINGRLGSYSTHVLGESKGAKTLVYSGGYYF